MITVIKKLDSGDYFSLKNCCNLFLNRCNQIKGLTLMELMLAAFILSFVLVGILGTYIACLDLVEISKDTSVAINNSQTRLEEIKNSNFADIKNSYNNIPFPVTGITGMGASYVDDTDPELLEITITVCWQQKNGRVMGEDLDLDGTLDAGEDTSPLNGILDSPAQVITYIAAP